MLRLCHMEQITGYSDRDSALKQQTKKEEMHGLSLFHKGLAAGKTTASLPEYKGLEFSSFL